MNELKIFSNPEFGQVRTVEMDGDAWLVGKDVAEALGYSDAFGALKKHVDEEDKLVCQIDSAGQKRDATVINESGLYSLVLSSRLPTAKKFRRWVTSEVLPSIRRTGGYLAGQEQLSPEELMARALLVAQKTIADREARISSLTVENQTLIPKAEYFDELVNRHLLTNFRETAKQLGVPPKKFTEFLLARKYIYRDKRGKLLPYEDKNSGYFKVKETYNEKTDWSGTQTLVTPKGREAFRLLYVG